MKVGNKYVFVEDKGEPGNSGTLMFARREHSKEILGTYYGIEEPRRGMRTRGVIASLPYTLAEGFSRLHYCKPMDFRDEKLTLQMEVNTDPEEFDVERYTEGTKYGVKIRDMHGVVLNENISYEAWSPST